MSLDRLTLTTRACERIDGRLERRPVPHRAVVFHVKDPQGGSPSFGSRSTVRTSSVA